MASAADPHISKDALKMQPPLTIRFEQRGAVAWITLNRPDAMNALSETMCAELRDVTERCERDPAIRVIVLTGAGRAFCAGADLKGVFESSAGESARIGDAHANFGVFPGAGGAAILPRRIGATAAKYLLFTGDTMPARELVPLGLVNRVVPDAELVSEVEKLALRIASKSPLVLRRMKQAVADGLEQPQASALRLERLVLDAHRHSHDIQEGLAAFVGKRTPDFKGY